MSVVLLLLCRYITNVRLRPQLRRRALRLNSLYGRSESGLRIQVSAPAHRTSRGVSTL